MILNLKKFNKFVYYKHFKMESINNVIILIKPNLYMESIDFKDAFFSVAIHNDHQKYLKACVRYFSSNFYFFTKWKPFKNCEKRFLFYLKSSFCSQDIQFFVFFSLPFHTFQIQKDKWKWNNFWCHELACINLQM